MMDEKLTEWIVNKLEKHSDTLKELAELTAKHSAILEILKRVLIYIFLFILVSSISLIFVFTKENVKNIVKVDKNSKPPIEEKVE